MAKIREDRPVTDQPKDSFDNAKPWHITKNPMSKADVNIVLGKGVYLSKHREYEFRRNADNDEDVKAGGKVYDRTYAQMMIPESTILAWAEQIRKGQDMKAESGRHSDKRDYQSRCHPGTDTEDPSKSESTAIRDKPNAFWLDRSRSTMIITQCSGRTFLNGSAVYHDHYVRFALHGPDGQLLAEWGMSYDQFASVLVSNMATPVTLEHYWSLEDNNVALREVVRPPESVRDRMQQRLKDRLGEVDERQVALIQELKAAEATGKPLGKKAIATIIHSLEVMRGNTLSSTDFVVEQAVEETTQVVETAAIRIANIYGINKGVILGMPDQRVAGLLGPHPDK